VSAQAGCVRVCAANSRCPVSFSFPVTLLLPSTTLAIPSSSSRACTIVVTAPEVILLHRLRWSIDFSNGISVQKIWQWSHQRKPETTVGWLTQRETLTNSISRFRTLRLVFTRRANSAARPYRRAFSVAGPPVFNSLPPKIRLSHSVDIFKRHLNTHLFTTP